MNSDSAELESLQNGSKPRIVSGLDWSLETKPLGEQIRAIKRQALMVILGNAGVLTVGLCLSVPTVIYNQLTDPTEKIFLSLSQVSWFTSIHSLSSPLGGLLSAYLLDKIGRKRTLYLLNILLLIAWIMMALTLERNSEYAFVQLLVSRFIIGIGIGLSAAPVGVYAAEISVPKIRGTLLLGTSITTALGITIMYAIGYFIRDDWHLIALICCGYQLVALICVIPMPETPSWLVSKGRLAEARKSLNFFRGLEKSATILHPEVDAEFSVLQKSIQLGANEEKPSFLESLRLPEVYRPMFILITLFAFQQLSGIFVVIVYAVQISKDAGVQIDFYMCAVLIGIARVISICPMGYTLEKWGRRRSSLISTLGMTICMFLLAGQGWWTWLGQVPYLPVIAMVSFIVLSTLGLYTVPFCMISELFPQKVRGPASGVTLATGMFFAFVCIKTYPYLKAAIGSEFCFVSYGVSSFIAMVFIYFYLPETRGRTLLEIEEAFRTKSHPHDDIKMTKVFVK